MYDLAADTSEGSLYRTLVAYDESSMPKQQTATAETAAKAEVDARKTAAWTIACTIPWETLSASSAPHVVVPRPGSKRGKATVMPETVGAARYGFTASNRICDVLGAAHNELKEILALRDAVEAGEAWASQRDVVGMMIRRWDAAAVGRWRLCVFSAMLFEINDKGKLTPNGPTPLFISRFCRRARPLTFRMLHTQEPTLSSLHGRNSWITWRKSTFSWHRL